MKWGELSKIIYGMGSVIEKSKKDRMGKDYESKYHVPKEASPKGEFLLGLWSGNMRASDPEGIKEMVPEGDLREIMVQPQIAFRPSHIIIDRDVAIHFIIHDIRVGKNSQFMTPHPIPATAFSGAFNPRLAFDTVQVSQEFRVIVQNIGMVPHPFRAAVVGAASW